MKRYEYSNMVILRFILKQSRNYTKNCFSFVQSESIWAHINVKTIGLLFPAIAVFFWFKEISFFLFLFFTIHAENILEN